MAVLKTDTKRIASSVQKSFLSDLDNHLKNFALTDRSRWILDAAEEKLSQEKTQLHEMREENENTDKKCVKGHNRPFPDCIASVVANAFC